MAVAQTLGAVVGENLQRLRERSRLTQHETARLLQRRGASWSRSKIAAVEAGERPNVTLADAIVLASTFNVELAELFAGDGLVELTSTVVLPRRVVSDVARGTYASSSPEQWDPEARRKELLNLDRLLAAAEEITIGRFGATEADHALAQRLDAPPSMVIDIAVKLWGQTLTEERDRRVAELGEKEVSERQAHRGHITRELSRQVQAELDRRESTNSHGKEDG